MISQLEVQAAEEHPAKCRMGSPRIKAILPPPEVVKHNMFRFVSSFVVKNSNRGSEDPSSDEEINA